MVDVCLLEGKPVRGIQGTQIPPNKNQVVKKIDEVSVDNYQLLVLPGGVKAMEKVRQEKKIRFKYCISCSWFKSFNTFKILI